MKLRLRHSQRFMFKNSPEPIYNSAYPILPFWQAARRQPHKPDSLSIRCSHIPQRMYRITVCRKWQCDENSAKTLGLP